VREAANAIPKRAQSFAFSLTQAGVGERVVAPILGLYLGFAVVRLPEVFAAFAIPKLPMLLMLLFLGILGTTIPAQAWTAIWQKSRALRLVSGLAVLAIGTAPVGIWPSESLLFIQDRYIVAICVFLCCLVFLRDRRALRLAVSLFVLSVTAVSADVVHTYDPNAVILGEDGQPLDPDVVAARPELRRLAKVGISLDSNDFGAILAAAFPLAIWLSVGSLGRRVFWGGTAILFVMAVVPTQSRGSMLGFGVAAVVLISAGAKGWRRWLTAVMVAGAAGLFLMMATGIGAAGRFTDFSADDYNLQGEGRWFFWKQGFIWMLKRPWGYGINNYPTYYGQLNGPERAAHSMWVQYGMELGVLGLAGAVLLAWWLVRGLQAHRKQAYRYVNVLPGARDEGILAGHVLAMLAATLVTGSFLSNAYHPMTYMAYGLAGAVLLGSPLPDDQPAPAMEPPTAARFAHRRPRRSVSARTPG
jgi:hypothetical protein